MTEEAAPNEFINPEQLQKDLKIDTTRLSECMANQASHFVHYATQTVRAKRQHERCKVALEIIEAKIDAEIRTKLSGLVERDGKGNDKPVKVTEPQVAAALRGDARWKAANISVINAMHQYRLCEAAERAFEHRREMLKQIGEDMRIEAQGQLRTQIRESVQDRARGVLDTMKKVADASQS
jgi:hypothetical protein